MARKLNQYVVQRVYTVRMTGHVNALSMADAVAKFGEMKFDDFTEPEETTPTTNETIFFDE
jgi:hypothetical protein